MCPHPLEVAVGDDVRSDADTVGEVMSVSDDGRHAIAYAGCGNRWIRAPGPYLRHIRNLGFVYRLNTGALHTGALRPLRPSRTPKWRSALAPSRERLARPSSLPRKPVNSGFGLGGLILSVMMCIRSYTRLTLTLCDG